MSDQNIRVRIAPSPTGVFHVGTLRTVLYNYLFAKHHGGTLITRIEDTDKIRSTKEFELDILSGIQNMGLVADESPVKGGAFGPYRQSERTEIYKKYLQMLLDQGKAYYCYCSIEELDKMRTEQQKNGLPPRYNNKCRNITEQEKATKIAQKNRSVIRFKTTESTDIKFKDLIRGEIITNSREIDDFVIAKDLDTPLYNFTVVVDDHLMNISHVIRGADHIANTPKQIMLYEAFGWDIPQFAHFPLLLSTDKKKLSKRNNPVSVAYT